MFKSVTFYIIVALVALLLGTGYLYKKEIEATGQLTQQRDGLLVAMKEVNDKLLEEQEKSAKLELDKNVSQSSFRITKQELDFLKGRQETVKAKPGLVQRKIQTSFDGYLDAIQCDTGAIEKCKR